MKNVRKLCLCVALVFVLALLCAIPAFAATTGNDSFGNATYVELGETVTGELSEGSRVDFYSFRIPTSGRVSITVGTTMGRTYYRLYNESTVQVWGDRYSNGLTESVELVAGVYYFYAEAYDAYGSYTLTLNFNPSEESFGESASELFNDLGTAPALLFDKTYKGHLAINDGVDYYKFTLPSSGRLHLTVGTTLARTYYRIYNESNVQVWGDRYSNGLTESVELLAGTYYFYVERYDGNGTYSLTLNFNPSNESFPESTGNVFNGLNSASQVYFDNTYTGHLAINDTVDYYKFTLHASGRLNLTVATTLSRTYYRLYNESNVQVWGDRYSNGLNESVELAAGTYYLYVEKYDSFGPYALTVNFTPAEESFGESVGHLFNGLDTAPLIETGTPYRGHLAVNDSTDYYKLMLEAPARLKLDVSTTMGRTYYRIYNENNAQIWGDRYSNGLSEEIDLIAGVYYFYVEAYDSRGTYTLNITETPARESCAEKFGNQNNDAADASSVALNTAYIGQLASNDKVDYYKFNVSRATSLTLNVTTLMGRTYYYIYNENLSKIWGDRYDGGVQDAVIELEAGTYYFYAEAYDSTGNYTFSLSEEHDCYGSFTVLREASCTEPGERTRNCHTCGKLLDSEVTPPTGHQSDEWVVDAEPTCSTEGKRHADCKVCGLAVEEIIPMLEHTFGEWEIIREVSCAAPGLQKRSCSVCEYEESDEPEQLAHAFGEWHVVSGNVLIPPIVQEKACANCDTVERTEDWSYVWVTVIAAVVLIGIVIGMVNYFKAFKKK